MLNNELWQAPPAGGGDFYEHQIVSSLRNSSAQDGTLQFTAGTPSSSTTMTMSYWVKRYDNNAAGSLNNIFVTGTGGSAYIIIGMHANTWNFQANGGSWGGGEMKPNPLYRDTSAWYHHVVRIDTTESTQADRIRMYVNGERITSFNTENLTGNLTSSESLSYINQDGVVQAWGGLSGKGHGTLGADLQMAEIVFNDGQSYAPSNYGETKNGVWIPKDPSGLTFGNNGYYLKMLAGAIGTDSSGNSNNFTVANFAAHDVMLDSPTFNSDSNGGNFCTYNPLQEQGGARKLMSLSEGNLQAESTTNDKYHQIIGNMGVKTGKWYIEWYIKAAGYPSWSVGWHHGDGLTDFTGDGGYAGNMQYMGYFTGNNVYITNFGNTSTGDPQVAHASFTNQGAPTTGDVIMCAIDNDAGKCWWGINGVWGNIGSGTGNPATGANASATWTIANYTDYKFPFTLSWANPVAKLIMNCGQEGTFAGNITAGGNADDTGYGNFKYDVPAGFLSLCTGNLPIADAIDPAQTSSNFPQKLFSATTYTGNGSASARNIDTGVASDWVWIKNRGASGRHMLYDSTRGVGKYLHSDTNAAEDTSGTSLSAFNSDGFQLSDNGTYLNAGSNTYVAYNWRSNGGTTSSGSGDLTSTHQVDPSGGFSIVKAVGDGGSGDKTVSHGLSAAPTVILAKNLDTTYNWDTFWAEGLAASTYGIRLNTNDDEFSGRWGTVNSSIFTCKDNYTWAGTNNYIYYCFTNIEGYIHAGTYKGNGLASGTFVYTGHKPAFLLIREVAQDNWLLYNNKTLGYNLDSAGNAQVYPDTDSAEENQASRAIDFLSNGFKLRTDNATGNASGGTYIYLSISSNPFQYATAR